MTELSELVSEANREREWSTRDIARRAEERGFKLSHSTASKVLNGSHGLINLETVFALEAVFGLSRDAITAAAGIPAVGGLYEPPREAAHLSVRQRKAISELILSIVKEGGAEDDRPATSQPPATGPGKQPVLRPVNEFEVDEAARRDPR